MSGVLFMRPTFSELLFRQQLGRGLRISPGKKKIQVLDFIGNWNGNQRISDFIGNFLNEDYSQKELFEKPIYEYDNGCKVEFEKTVVRDFNQTQLKPNSDLMLVEEYYKIYKQWKGRVTINRLQFSGEYKLYDYIQQYGSLQKFMERISKIDSSASLEGL